MNALTVHFRQDAPETFAQWEASPEFAHGLAHPSQTSAGQRYYTETCDGVVDTSFAVARGDKPLMLVRCNLWNGRLGYFIHPLSLLESNAVSDTERESLVDLALKTVDAVAEERSATSVSLREEIRRSQLDVLGKACVNRGAIPHIAQTGECDLSWDEQRIHRNTRKSFRSLINWGRRNLSVEYFNAQNPDRKLFDRYRDFHAQVAGRVTRPDKSWQAMCQWILDGDGELALAYLENKQLVAGTMTVDGKERSFYASGVYDRTQFDKPLAHFPLYDAILRSQARGMKFYELGDLPGKGSASDKDYTIGFFKRGFATAVQMHIVWKWDLRPTAIAP